MKKSLVLDEEEPNQEKQHGNLLGRFSSYLEGKFMQERINKSKELLKFDCIEDYVDEDEELTSWNKKWSKDEDSSIEYLGSDGFEKLVFDVEGQITCIACLQNFVIWGGKQLQEAGHEENFLYLSKYNFVSEEYSSPERIFTTSSPFLHLDFDNPGHYYQLSNTCHPEVREAAAIDGEGILHVYNLEQKQKILSKKFEAKHLTCLSYQRKHSKSEAWVAIGTERDEVEIFEYVAKENGILTSLYIGAMAVDETKNSQEHILDKLTMKFDENMHQDQIFSHRVKLKGKPLQIEIIPENCRKMKFFLIAADNHGHIMVFDVLHSGEVSMSFFCNYKLHETSGHILSVSDHGERMALACGDKKVRVLKRPKTWEHRLNEHEPVCVYGWEEVFDLPLDYTPPGISISSDGDQVAIVGHTESGTRVFDVSIGCQVHCFPNYEPVFAVCFDNNRLWTASSDGIARAYNMYSGFEAKLCVHFDPELKTVQSVSLDDKCERMAVGTTAGHCFVYKRSGSDWKVEMDQPVGENVVASVVQLSANGKLLAIGDSFGCVHLFELSPKFEWERFDLITNDDGYICGLDICNVSDSTKSEYLIAIASSTKHAFVYTYSHVYGELKGEASSHVQFEVSVGEVVFDVSLSRDAVWLAVAVKNGKTRIFDAKTGEEKDMFDLKEIQKVRCIAFSQTIPAMYIAVGGDSRECLVYNLMSKTIILKAIHNATIHKLDFFDETTLVVGSEDGKCTVYDLVSQIQILELSLNGSCCDLSLSRNGVLAVAHGRSITVFGKTDGTGYDLRDRPSLELAKDLMKSNLGAFQISLNAHPTLANIQSNRPSLLHIAVQERELAAMDIILNGHCPVGLEVCKSGRLQDMTALSLAVVNRQKVYVDKIINALARGKIKITPAVYASLFNMVSIEYGYYHKEQNRKSFRKTRTTSLSLSWSFLEPDNNRRISLIKLMGKAFPDSLLLFFKGMKLEECESSVSFGLNLARLDGLFYIGLPFRSPFHFWRKFYDRYHTQDSQFAASKLHVSVEAWRIPMKDVCGGWSCSPTEQQYWTSPLEVLVEASIATNDYSVFDKNTAVYNLVMYKWSILEVKFRLQYFKYLIYILVCSLAEWGMCVADEAETTLDIYKHSVWGKISVCSSPFLIVWSAVYLLREIKQIKAEYAHQDKNLIIAIRYHFTAEIWNIIQFCGFTTQLIANVLVFVRPLYSLDVTTASILLLYANVLYYARGFFVWGPLVRLIQSTIAHMALFLCLYIGIIFAFAIGLTFTFHNTYTFDRVDNTLIAVSLMIYGYFFDDLIDQVHNQWSMATVMVEVFLLVVCIILLNLLIAIMTDTYADAKLNADQQTICDLAAIIVEIEKQESHDLREDLFPHWVHILKPVN